MVPGSFVSTVLLLAGLVSLLQVTAAKTIANLAPQIKKSDVRPAALASPAAGVVFQTSFNCAAEWNQGLPGYGLPCLPESAIKRYGDWHTSGHPAGDQVITAANNPKGTGMGFRHWRGDGQNNNGGSIQVSHAALQEQFGRMYMRYQQGFKWSWLNYTKDLYINIGGMPVATLGFHDDNSFGIAGVNPGWGNPTPARGGWNLVSQRGQADGLFHCYQWHIRLGTKGLAEAWIDGKQTQKQNVDFGSGSLQGFVIGENQATPANVMEMYTDYDDFVVSGTAMPACLP